MIRHRHGDEFFLITQHDHALLSGRLAEQLGGRHVARADPAVVTAISLHDVGWPIHDDQPTLDSAGLPLHVFEAPIMLATRIWSESSVRAAQQDPYAGLLVSLHGLHLSLIAQQRAARHTPHELFEVNKFQHRQIELQESLRPRVGLRTDLPLTHGLAPPRTSAAEDKLLFDFRLLQAMDRLSLAACCSETLFETVELLAGPGLIPVTLRVTRPAEFEVGLHPWPFGPPLLEFSVPYHGVPARPFSDEPEFRQVYARATTEAISVRFRPA